MQRALESPTMDAEAMLPQPAMLHCRLLACPHTHSGTCQDGVIGAYLAAADFEAYGADYIFAGLGGEEALAPVGQGIGQIVSDADISRPEPEEAWSSDSQYGERG